MPEPLPEPRFAQPPDDVQLGPFIQAFEILSDRMSNVEEGVSLLLGNARQRECRAFGELDNRILGIPCPVVRLPDRFPDADPDDPPYRQEYRADGRVSALIVGFEGLRVLGDHSRREDGTLGCVMRDFLTPAETGRLSNLTGDRVICCKTGEMGIHSIHERVCEETVARRLESLRLDLPTLSRCMTCIPCFRTEDFAVLIVSATPLPVQELLAESYYLAKYLAGSLPKRVLMYDSEVESVRDYQMVCAKLFSGDVNHRTAAESYCRRNRPAMESLDYHHFFWGAAHNFPPNWKES